MSDDTASSEAPPPTSENLLRAQAHEYFRNTTRMLFLLSAFFLMMLAPAQAVAIRKWHFVLAMLLLVGILALLPWFRFLWRQARWFRSCFLVQIVISVAFALASLSVEASWPGLAALAATIIVLIFLRPGMHEFARRFDLPRQF